ncbi:MAG: C40 family peptidase [Akkermansiaceae bacterium]|nr:C40 family peptidase [Armatimonadota bacterium]
MTFLRADIRSEVVPPVSTRRAITLRSAFAAAVYTALAIFSLGLFAPSVAIAKAPKSRKAMVRAQTVRLRSAPGKKSKATALLGAGRVARVLEKRDGWAKLKLASGKTGWVRADLLAINKKKTKDTGAFAAQHPVAAPAPRRVRRTKTVIAAKSTPVKRSAQKVATRKPILRPKLVAKAKPPAKAKPVARHAQVARVAPQRIYRALPAPRPTIMPDAQIEPIVTEGYETASLREGVGAQSLADLPTNAPQVALAELKEAVPPTATAAEVAPVEMTTAPEAIAVSAPIPKSKSIKGGVAPAVRVPIVRASKRGDRIVNRALTYRGVPYRMGAPGGRGAFDCSSFTRYILRQSGENLPRTAAEQYRKGTPVDKDEMRAGDLVFFKNTYKRGVSHVGIFMGNGKFIHASSRGGVKESNLNDSYYVNHWAGARRPNVTQGFD